MGRIDLHHAGRFAAANLAFSMSLASGCFWSSFRAIATTKLAFVFGMRRCGLLGLLRHQAAAVENCDGPDTIGARGRRAERERTAEAIALYPGGLFPVGRLLLVEEGNERRGVAIDRRIRECVAEAFEQRATLGMLKSNGPVTTGARFTR